GSWAPAGASGITTGSVRTWDSSVQPPPGARRSVSRNWDVCTSRESYGRESSSARMSATSALVRSIIRLRRRGFHDREGKAAYTRLFLHGKRILRDHGTGPVRAVTRRTAESAESAE